MSNSMGGLKVDNKIHERMKKLAAEICREELKISKGIPFTCEDHRIAFLNRCLEGRDMAVKVIERGEKELKKVGVEMPDLSVETENEETIYETLRDGVLYVVKTMEYMVGYGLQAVNHADLRRRYMEEVRITSDNWFNRIIELEQEMDITTRFKETEKVVKEMLVYRRSCRMEYVGQADDSMKRFAIALELDKLESLEEVVESRAITLFKKEFTQLDDFQKMKVFDRVLKDAGQTSRLFDVATDAADFGKKWLLRLTFMKSVYDIYSSQDRVKTFLGELAGYLAGNYIGGPVGEMLPSYVIKGIESVTGVDIKRKVTSTVVGVGLLLSNLAGGVLYGEKADWLVTKLYESATADSGGVFEGKTRTKNPFYMAGAAENGYNLARSLNF